MILRKYMQQLMAQRRMRPILEDMIAVVEQDRQMARRLAAALEARGCRARVAGGYAAARALFAEEVPRALYISEALQRMSGGDLLAEYDNDERFAVLPALVRVSRQDSVFARAMRRGGLQTIVAPFDVEAAAATLERMSRGEEGTLRAILYHSRTLRERTADNRKRVGVMAEKPRRVGSTLRRRDD